MQFTVYTVYILHSARLLRDTFIIFFQPIVALQTWHMALMLYRCPLTFLQSVTFNTSSLFQADIKPNGTDTHQLTKLLDRGIVDCQCALVCVSAPGCTCPCVLQMFIGRCHSYAALPSRDHAEIRPQVLCCVAKP